MFLDLLANTTPTNDDKAISDLIQWGKEMGAEGVLEGQLYEVSKKLGFQIELNYLQFIYLFAFF